MGVVRASYDPALDREIAVKVLGPRDLAMLRDTDDPTCSRIVGTEGPASITSAAIDDAQLLAEARALARVAHPNIVEVFDVGVWEGGVFLAMELVDGVSLRAWNGEHAPDWRTAVAMHLQAGDALAAAHAVGIVHGDFKPDNVLVTATDRVKVVDFGLARAIGRVEADDRSAVVFGTPAYLAPECWDDASRQPSADQFAFFVSLCEAITNRRPYARVDSLTALLLALQDGPQLEALRRLAPSRLVRIVARGLDPDPARRFATMSEALGELRAVVAHDRRSRRRWFVAAAGLGAALPLAALATAPHLRERASLAACTTTAQAIGEVWNDDARGRVSAAMTQADARIGAETATRAIGWLDAYAAEWSALAEATCPAGVAEPSDLEHARARCFADRTAALAAFIEVLEAADADVVRNAVTAATELPRIDACYLGGAIATHVRMARTSPG